MIEMKGTSDNPVTRRLTHRPLRVLLVDDNDAGRLRLADVLAREGFEVDVARSGLHLLDHLLSSRLPGSALPTPHAILAVVRGGGVTLEALTSLARRGWDVPLLVIRATDAARVRRRIKGLRAACILEGSTGPEALSAALRELAQEQAHELRWGRIGPPVSEGP